MKALEKNTSLLRLALLCGIVLAILFIGSSVLLHPAIISGTGLSTVLWPLGLLLVYGLVTVRLTTKAGRAVTTAIWEGTTFGLLIGASFVLDITVENFIDLARSASTFSTVGFMALIFLLFGLAGARGTLKTAELRLGILASVWSALLGVVIALLFGFAINFFFQQRLEQILQEEYVRSHMHDVQAFIFFNTLDSASSHLLEAPILAALFGTIGACITKSRLALEARRGLAKRQSLE